MLAKFVAGSLPILFVGQQVLADCRPFSLIRWRKITVAVAGLLPILFVDQQVRR
jgi:hypothetical protein